MLTNKSGLPEEIIERTVSPHNVSHLSPPETPVAASERTGPVATWLIVWLVIASMVVTWDSAYVLLRPWSMVGHADAKPWASIWTPYVTYGKIDSLYGPAGYAAYKENKEGFNAAQSVVNVVEVTLQLGVLYLSRAGVHLGAHVLALIVLSMTLCKTALYFLVDIFQGCAVHAAAKTPFEFWFYYVTMNGLWVVMPLLGIFSTALRLLTVG